MPLVVNTVGTSTRKPEKALEALILAGKRGKGGGSDETRTRDLRRDRPAL